MAIPSHIPSSIRELALLADEIWFLAGDISVDSSWYSKRASLSTIYASTELFMTTDSSRDFADTEQFLDRRLEEARVVGSTIKDVGKWVGFNAMGVINLVRSKGARI